MTDQTPTIDEFRPVVLRVLADGQEQSARAIRKLATQHMGLSEEVLAEKVPSGQPRYRNRINWACSALTHAGLLERPRRAYYRITANGHAVDQRSLSSYTEKDMLEWQDWRDYQAEIAKRNRTDETPNEPQSVPAAQTYQDQDTDPIEVMSEAAHTFNAQTETDLRKRLQSASPDFFEQAVVDLLWAMGYGGTHGEKQRVGGTGDGGIDGVIRQDALGLTNVYVQAKRYTDKNTVGSDSIRNFIGALDSKGATLGVFITTSEFTPSAEHTAAGYRHGKIVLIDGIKLTGLMLDYGVAVHQSRQFTLYEIDDDFFDDELA